VFQHSQATQLHISLCAQGEAAVLRLMDNGVGFEVPELTSLSSSQTDHGRAQVGQGLRSMVARAQTIRAQLHLRSQPGNTTLTITLKRPPHERRAKARAG
jgi:signal transduction histidine kinase